MAFADKMASRVQPSPRIFSEQTLKRFADPLDCLTAHLMLECAEILATGKQATLYLNNSSHPFFCRTADNDYQIHGVSTREHSAARPLIPKRFKPATDNSHKRGKG